MMLGDNIYHRENPDGPWSQENSHHSRPDGTPDESNIETDTRTNKVLISRHFVYFGVEAPEVPERILDEMGYRNGRDHRVFELGNARELLRWFDEVSHDQIGTVVGDPFQFRDSTARYSAGSNKIIKEAVEPVGIETVANVVPGDA